MQVVPFDFRNITGLEYSKQENFSSLCNRLIMKIFLYAKPVDGKGGDEGIDTIIGIFNGICQTFQHKYFINRIGKSQRRQIEKSLKTAIEHHSLEQWTLMIPINLNSSEIKWFQNLKQKYAPLKMDWWGKEKLQQLLSEHIEIANDFQPPRPIIMVISQMGLKVMESSEEEIANAFKMAIGGKETTNLPDDAILSAAREIKSRAKLKVLILGPGASGGEIYKKRCKIKDELIELGHEAHFYEDFLKPDVLKDSGLNLSVAEYLQVKKCDYIICLMASPGSIGEVHEFAIERKIASKMMICVDQSHKEGYSAQGILRIFEGNNGKIDWFEYPKDILECYLATRVLDKVLMVEEAKQWEIAKGVKSS